MAVTAATNGACIDRWEAHLVVEPSGDRHPHEARPEAGLRYRAASSPGVPPQAYLSRTEAASACANAGKRLCSLDEWRGACRGSERRIYPYGTMVQSDRCNAGKAHLLGILYGRDPKRWSLAALNAPALALRPDFLTPTGAHDGCATPDGVYDLVGNLHEWVADTATKDLLERLGRDRVHRDKQPWRKGNAVFVGGFYSNRAELGPGCLYTTWAHRPSYHDYSIGFRCCRAALIGSGAPEPHAALD